MPPFVCQDASIGQVSIEELTDIIVLSDEEEYEVPVPLLSNDSDPSKIFCIEVRTERMLLDDSILYQQCYQLLYFTEHSPKAEQHCSTFQIQN